MIEFFFLLSFLGVNVMQTSATNEQQCESQNELLEEQTKTSSSQTSLALLPYDGKRLFSIFHEGHRQFNFGSQNITIYQDWDNLGVAAVVWDSALVLCEYLEKNTDLIKNKKAIELGAGTGLVGIVAGILGGDVIITDRASAVGILDKNIKLNSKELSVQKMTSDVLDWTEHQDSTVKYDVILGADIIYIKETFQDLLRTLQNLSDQKTLILLSAKIRYERDTDFLSLLENYFTVKEIVYHKEKDVWIFEVKKNN